MKRFFAAVAFACASQLACVGLAAAQQPYLGEVRLLPYNFCPTGWIMAQGQLLPISQNTALFSLYGTNFGGDGRTTFALPNLQGRAPYGPSAGEALGTAYSASSVTLTTTNQPHPLLATTAGQLLTTVKSDEKIHATGSNQTVTAQSPALALTWCVALQGIFPSRD